MIRLAFLLVVAMLATPLACAETFVVTRNDDPAPNGCLPGDCSLREALIDASADPGTLHTILLDGATYGLPRGGLTYAGQIRISGNSNTTTTIEGDGVEPVLTASGAASIQLLQLAIKAHGQHALDASVDGDTFLYRLRIPEADSQVWVQGSSDGLGNVQVIQSEIRAYFDCGRSQLCQVRDSQMLRLQAGKGGATRVSISGSTFDGDFVQNQSSGVVVHSTEPVTISHTTIQNGDIGLVFSGTPQPIAVDHLHFIGNERPLRLAEIGRAHV